eukprot:gene10227-11916_t
MFANIQSDVPADKVRATIKSYFQSWTESDATTRIDLFANDAIVEDPVGFPALKGKEAIQTLWAKTTGVKIQMEVERTVINGNEALVQYKMTSTIPSSAPFVTQIYYVLKFNASGKITHLKSFWDADCIGI